VIEQDEEQCLLSNGEAEAEFTAMVERQARFVFRIA
jgi:hypothetical protein